MLCSLAKRAISRSEDRGTERPRWVERHIARCEACREYARFTDSLRGRLAAEREALLAGVPEFPLNEAAWTRADEGRRDRPVAGRRLVLRPLPAAAAGSVVVAAALFLFLVVLKQPAPTVTDRPPALASLRSLTAAADGLPGVVAEAETSLDRERRILESSLASAVEYLQARLNIRIERRERQKPA